MIWNERNIKMWNSSKIYFIVIRTKMSCRNIFHYLQNNIPFFQYIEIIQLHAFTSFAEPKADKIIYLFRWFDVFSTVHRSIGLFLQPTLMHNSMITCMSHYYPRHVSGPWHAHPQEEQMHKHSIWYLRSHKRLYTTPVESRLR